MAKGYIELNKIPKGCYNCTFCSEVKELNELVCLADSEMRRTNYNKKPKWCPVKVVKE